MKTKDRISLDMSFLEILVALSEGNPGAISVLGQLFKQAPAIDPDGMLGGYGPLMWLDTFGVYGPDIWTLYKDICGEDITTMLARIRATQLGIIATPGSVMDSAEVVRLVKTRLPEFGR